MSIYGTLVVLKLLCFFTCCPVYICAIETKENSLSSKCLETINANKNIWKLWCATLYRQVILSRKNDIPYLQNVLN